MHTGVKFRTLSDVSEEELVEGVVKMVEALNLRSGSVFGVYNLYEACEEERQKAIKAKSFWKNFKFK